MASRKFEKGSEEWQLFMDFWKFCQDYAEPEESDSFWDDVIEKSEKLCRKYSNSQFCIDIILSHICELERKQKGKRS